MRVQVVFDNDSLGDPLPRRFALGERWICVTAIRDRWLSPERGHFKVEDEAGNVYVLVQGAAADDWELVLFQRPGAAT